MAEVLIGRKFFTSAKDILYIADALVKTVSQIMSLLLEQMDDILGDAPQDGWKRLLHLLDQLPNRAGLPNVYWSLPHSSLSKIQQNKVRRLIEGIDRKVITTVTILKVDMLVCVL